MPVPTLLVTRPVAQAEPWVQQLRTHGALAAALPLLAIEAAADVQPVVLAWHALPGYALVMFVSANAVQHFFAACPPGVAWPNQVVAASTGPGTTAALLAQGLGLSQCVGPQQPPFDSEALWALLRNQDWAGRRVLVVRGEGGRDWLAEQLADHGAQISYLAAYRRALPALDAPQQALLGDAQAHPQRYRWWFTSAQAIDHLQVLAPQANWSRSQALASHPRIAQRARQLGFGQVDEAPPLLPELLAYGGRPIQSQPS